MRLTFTGDILVEQEQFNALQGKPYDEIMLPMAEVFSKTDYLIGNLETPVAGEELGYTSHMWSFNTPQAIVASLKKAGFKLLTTANNHCLDRGVKGLEQTLATLDAYNIDYTGTQADPKGKRFYEINEGRHHIAILSYTYGTNAAFNQHYLDSSQLWMVNLFQPQEKRAKPIPTYNIPARLCRKIRTLASYYRPRLYKDLIKADINAARANGAESVIMCLHTGGQYAATPSKQTQYIVKWLFQNGVDIIIGNHEHVIHKAEWLNNKFCAYCLGNFTATPGSAASSMQEDAISNKTDYSILPNLDFNDGSQIPEVGFQIVKSIVGNDNISRVYPLYELISNEQDLAIRNALIVDNEWIVKKVTGIALNTSVPVQPEYKIPFSQS